MDDLQKEIIQDLRRVESSAFFNQKDLLIKIGVIVVLCFLILNVHPIQFRPIKVSFPDIKPKVSFDFTGTTLTGTKLVKAGKKQQAAVQLIELSDNIYGDATVAVLGEKELVIQLKAIEEELMVRDEEEFEEEAKKLSRK